MQTTSSNISLNTKHIRLHLSTEMSDMLSIRISRSCIVITCLLLILGILGAVAMSTLDQHAAADIPLRASLYVETGTIYVIDAETGQQTRLVPGDSLLVDRGDHVLVYHGKALITHFDGTVQTIESSGATTVSPVQPVEEQPAEPTPRWFQPFWERSDAPRNQLNAASVLG